MAESRRKPVRRPGKSPASGRRAPAVQAEPSGEAGADSLRREAERAWAASDRRHARRKPRPKEPGAGR